MPSLLLIGNKEKCASYISDYIISNSYQDYEVTIFSEKILIEHARQIVHSLSFQTSGKKLFVLDGDITIEAQNALLKNIEELPLHVSLIITARTSSDLLTTIQSRCSIITLGSFPPEKDENIYSTLLKYIQGKSNVWSFIEEIESNGVLEHDPDFLTAQLRFLLLDTNVVEKRNVYDFCKRLLQFSSLSEKNNVNKRIILEKVFMY